MLAVAAAGRPGEPAQALAGPSAYARGVPRPGLLLLAFAFALLGVVTACGSDGASRVEVTPGAPAGDIRAVAGTVMATRDGVARGLAVGDVVSGDDVIATGPDGDISIELRHNGAIWNLGAGLSRRVADAAAWNAPRKQHEGGATGDRSAAAGRHGEREAADTAATAVPPGTTTSTSGVTAEAEREDPVRETAAAPPPVGAPEAVGDNKSVIAPTDGKPRKATGKGKGSSRDAPAKPTGGGGDDGCDEVSCLLAASSTGCCAMYRKGGGTAERKIASDADLPAALTAADIKAGMARIRAQVQACGAEGETGVVKVQVVVSGGGQVTSVTVQETPGEALGKCVAKAVRRASFAKSAKGATFTFPFSF